MSDIGFLIFFGILILFVVIVAVVVVISAVSVYDITEVIFSMVFSTFISSHGKLVLAMLLWRAVTYYLVIFAGIVALAVKPDKIKTED